MRGQGKTHYDDGTPLPKAAPNPTASAAAPAAAGADDAAAAAAKADAKLSKAVNTARIRQSIGRKNS